MSRYKCIFCRFRRYVTWICDLNRHSADRINTMVSFLKVNPGTVFYVWHNSLLVKMVGVLGFEPRKPLVPKTSALTKLSYTPKIMAVLTSFDLATFAVTRRHSPD